MKYLTFVHENRSKFIDSGHEKAASDIAKLLDSDLLSIDLSGDVNYEVPRIVNARKNIFTIFCALCLDSKVDVPEYENIFLEFYSKDYEEQGEKEKEKVLAIGEKIIGAIKETKEEVASLRLMFLAEIFCSFPSLAGRFSQFGIENLLAIANKELISIGLQPIRPDYSKVELPNFNGKKPAPEGTKILIVDDSIPEIVRTAESLIGWQGISVDAYHYVSSSDWIDEHERPAEVNRVVKDILNLEPDIVLMDEGLGSINGSQLVPEIIKSKDDIIVVANTAGPADKLHASGALDNAAKGSDLSGVKKAIDRLTVKLAC